MSSKAYMLFTFLPPVVWIQRHFNEHKHKGTFGEIFPGAYLKKEAAFPLRTVGNIFIS